MTSSMQHKDRIVVSIRPDGHCARIVRGAGDFTEDTGMVAVNGGSYTSPNATRAKAVEVLSALARVSRKGSPDRPPAALTPGRTGALLEDLRTG